MKIPELSRAQYVAFEKEIKRFVKAHNYIKRIWGPTFDNPHLLVHRQSSFVFIFPRLIFDRNYAVPSYISLHMIYTYKKEVQKKIAQFESIPPLYEIKAAFAAAIP